MRALRALLVLALMISALSSGSVPENGSRLEIDFQRFDQELARRFGPDALTAFEAWKAMLAELEPLDDRAKLAKVNAFFHQHMTYRLDSDLYGQEDYWATPLESLGHGAGDCEDYVIAKYVSLLHAGIDDDRLRLVYVRARIGGPRSNLSQAHMVLTYQASNNAEPLVLDSLLEEILPASLRDDLQPVFSFNFSGMWADGSQTSLGSSTARLSRWRDAIERMRAEGIAW